MLGLGDARVAINGLGYVGLPLAVEFGKRSPTLGFDIDEARIDELRAGRDSTLKVEPDKLQWAACLTYTNNSAELAGCNLFIVTVPMPLDEFKQPDPTTLRKASETVGGLLRVAVYDIKHVFPKEVVDARL